MIYCGGRHRRDQRGVGPHPEQRGGGRWPGWRRAEPVLPPGGKPLVGATMFGVTTPCVTARASGWRSSATRCSSSTPRAPAGSRWKRSSRSGFITGVLDVTTTELADELVGGVLSAGPDRLEAAGELGIPQVVSLGALDMVNFGPIETRAASSSADRLLYKHNPTVTLMRTTPEESAELGRRIAAQAERGARAGDAVRPAARRLADRDRGPAVPRPGGRRGLFGALREHIDAAASTCARWTPTSTTRRFAHGDGRAAPRAASRGRATAKECRREPGRGPRPAAGAGRRAGGRSSARAPAPASRRSAPRRAART